MPSYENLIIGLGLTACGVGTGAAIRLYCQSLHRRYRFLFAFLCFAVLRSLALLIIGSPAALNFLHLASKIPHRHQAYAKTWVHTEPALWLFYICIVLELYSLVLTNYKGLQTVGRWVFLIAITLAVSISAASVIPTWSNPEETASRLIFYYALISRGIMFSLVLFILLILFFLSWYPISLSRNLVIHAVVCTVFLISASMSYLVRNVQGARVTHAVNVANLVITICCWAAWMLLLTRKGEGTRMIVRREWTPEEEKRLVDQLTAINSSLLKAIRKEGQNEPDMPQKKK